MRPMHALGTLLTTAALAVSASAATVGSMAPRFSAMDSDGHNVSLDQYKGKYVVLEWTNRDCPYTKKQYESGNMQHLQKEWRAKGVVWLTVLSSASGQQGFAQGPDENAWIKKVGADPQAALLDPSGRLAHLYDAKTTPDMFVINPMGKLIYSGAIDSKPTTDVSDVKGADNYVSDALNAAMAGQPIAHAYERPYGCSIKYGD